MSNFSTRNLATITSLCLSILSAACQDQSPTEQLESKWESTASAGLTLTRGNSESFLANLSVTSIRKAEMHVITLGASATYGRTKDSITDIESRTADAYRGYAQYDYLFDERIYAYGRVEGLYDSIAAINYRFTLNPGIGYYIIKEKEMDLSLEAGPGYILQKLGGDESDYATLRAAQKFHWQLNDRARIWETVEWLPKVEDFANYIINGEIGVAADLNHSKSLSLSVVLQDVYNSKPATGRQENDLKLIASLNYRF